MKINEVEALVGVTKKNIRFYEEQGLLSPGRDSANGYRDYGEVEVETLKRIKLMRKLGVPIAEIRQMLEGVQTVGDGMRRHLVTLERERDNLEESIRMCTLLKERRSPLNELDAQAVLSEMEQLEHAGTVFENAQRRDVRVRYIGPVIAAAAMTLLMGLFIALMIWQFAAAPEEAPPLWGMAILLAVPALVIGGVWLALIQRIREIGKGELDDARKY